MQTLLPTRELIPIIASCRGSWQVQRDYVTGIVASVNEINVDEANDPPERSPYRQKLCGVWDQGKIHRNLMKIWPCQPGASIFECMMFEIVTQLIKHWSHLPNQPP